MSCLAVTREIAPTAQVARGAWIGPYCVIGPHAAIGPRTVLRGRVSITGHVRIGAENVFEEGCVLGAEPQDLKYRGEPSRLHVGDRNRFGRLVTVHIGTAHGGHYTRIRNDNVLEPGCHVAHDCYIDDRTRLGRNVLLAGHVRVQTGAVVEDFAGAHHFTTIGRFARVGRRTPVRRDVPPYTWFRGEDFDRSPPAVRGLHEDGIRAASLRPAEERELRKALHELFEDESALQTKIEQLVNLGAEGEVAELCAFCQRSLQGVYGRHRERYRRQTPPEAQELLRARPDPQEGPQP